MKGLSNKMISPFLEFARRFFTIIAFSFTINV
jgi:hypothetical protein